MWELTKIDHDNLRKLLESVEIKGAQAAKAVAVLAHKLEHIVANWVETDEKAEIEEPPFN